MNIQTVITATIVAVAVVLTLRHLWRVFHPRRDNTTNCSYGCDNCPMKGKKCTIN